MLSLSGACGGTTSQGGGGGGGDFGTPKNLVF